MEQKNSEKIVPVWLKIWFYIIISSSYFLQQFYLNYFLLMKYLMTSNILCACGFSVNFYKKNCKFDSRALN